MFSMFTYYVMKPVRDTSSEPGILVISLYRLLTDKVETLKILRRAPERGGQINKMAMATIIGTTVLRRTTRNLRPLSRLLSTETHPKIKLEPYELTHETIFNEDHAELRVSLNKFIQKEINPFVDEWENAKSFPAHELFKKIGSAGFFGVNKPTRYGGLGLDYSFSVAMAEELGEKRTYTIEDHREGRGFSLKIC